MSWQSTTGLILLLDTQRSLITCSQHSNAVDSTQVQIGETTILIHWAKISCQTLVVLNKLVHIHRPIVVSYLINHCPHHCPALRLVTLEINRQIYHQVLLYPYNLRPLCTPKIVLMYFMTSCSLTWGHLVLLYWRSLSSNCLALYLHFPSLEQSSEIIKWFE